MLKNLKIWILFVLSFGSIPVFMITIILIGLSYLRSGNERLKSIIEVNNTWVSLVTEMAYITRDNSVSIRNMIIARNDTGAIKEMQDSINRRRLLYDEDWANDTLRME